MQVFPQPLPSSPPSTPPRSSKHAHAHAYPHRRISSKASLLQRTSSSSSTANAATPSNPTSPLNSPLGVVDLTDSPPLSSCSSNPSLSLSPSPAPSQFALPAPKPTRPPRSLSPLLASKSTPAFSVTPQPRSASADLTPPSRAGTPRRRATFLLPGDGDSDRDGDRDIEGESAHDDSDDSESASFFSAEEYAVPTSILHDAVHGARRVPDAHEEQVNHYVEGWQPEEEHRKQHRELKQDSKPDAAHGLRRWHALMEIIHTEAGYVRDLRVLVNVYLSILPSLPLAASAREAVEELAKEGAKLLALHERFSRALQIASAHVVGGASQTGSLDDAIKHVAGLFVNEASTFDLYQHFCAAQPDALRLLRPAQARAEWVAFERQCAAGGGGLEPVTQGPQNQVRSETRSDASGSTAASVTASRSTSAPTPPLSRKVTPTRTLSLLPSAFRPYAIPPPSSQVTSLSANPRRHSYDSLAAVFSTYSAGTSRHRPGVGRPASEGTAGTATSASAPPSPSSRLRFHDFLIKPVQRICKYPLMLEGLRSKAHGGSADAIVANAVENMRAVAMRVDEARRRREAAAKSKLFVERVEPHAVVTPDFLSSLGDCLLAGSLDVVHHHHVLDPVTTPVRVKYLGAFLYLGGYLILVKVGKGKAYRVKHWFSLAQFEVVDIPPDIALVPSSFRLSYMDHHFEIAAACQREKDLWMRAMNEARCVSPTWHLEPASSLQTLHVEPSVTPPAADGSNQDTVEQTVPIKRGASSSSMSELSNPLAVLGLTSTRSRPPASTALTVKYIFSHTAESSILLRRSSEANRTFVDRGLVDVLSGLVSSVRKQAEAREESLFPPPQSSDTSQTIGRAAKNRLMRRSSVLVARPRSLLGPGMGAASTEEDAGTAPSSTVRRKSTTTYRKRMSMLPALSVLYTEPESIEGDSPGLGAELQFPGPDSASDKVPPPSAPASTSSHTQTSQSAASEAQENNLQNHRRARSLVGSVKELVRRATTKSTSAQEASQAWQILRTPDDSSSDAGESTETGSKSSIGRRRVSSAPTSPPLSSAASIFLHDSGRRSPPMTPSSGDPPPTSSDMDPPSPSNATSLKPPDEKSEPIPIKSEHTLKPRRSFKSFMFYNRLSAVDPA